MTKKSESRKQRDRLALPHPRDVAAIKFSKQLQRPIVVKNSMLTNQIYRDCPKVARSFDKIVKPHIEDISPLYSVASSMLLEHLPDFSNKGFKATASRLLHSAINTYTASIQTARNGYRNQYGMLARPLIETLATVIVLAIREDAVEEFHDGKLPSSKCIGWAKPAIPPLGGIYRMYNDFVHIGQKHDQERSSVYYKIGDQDLDFIISSMRGHAWLIYVVCELIFHDEIPEVLFWKSLGEGRLSYEPSAAITKWSEEFINPDLNGSTE